MTYSFQEIVSKLESSTTKHFELDDIILYLEDVIPKIIKYNISNVEVLNKLLDKAKELKFKIETDVHWHMFTGVINMTDITNRTITNIKNSNIDEDLKSPIIKVFGNLVCIGVGTINYEPTSEELSEIMNSLNKEEGYDYLCFNRCAVKQEEQTLIKMIPNNLNKQDVYNWMFDNRLADEDIDCSLE